ncbi:MAG: tetratricopeptide repeat protein [Deltaproteobacteria bacterium]|nr:tetratricopeptide repeat protein [Deltaproteobacteria bacterium]
MNRSSCRSLVCSSVALAIALAPSVSVAAVSVAAGQPADDVEVPDDSASATAAPADDNDPEALSAEAAQRYQAKDYDGAVELFEKAYELDPQPNYLFNIGRVYEEKGDLENAVVYYQRFVGQSGVDLESRQTATERLKILREAVAQMKAEDETDEPVDETEPVDEGIPVDEETNEDAEAAAKRKRTLRITGYSLMGVGGGALIIGAVFGGLASGNANEAADDMFVDRKIALRNTARTQARVADAMFITGGILAAGGLVLVLSTVGGKKSGGDGDKAVARRTMWAPVVGPRQVGLGLTHRF